MNNTSYHDEGPILINQNRNAQQTKSMKTKNENNSDGFSRTLVQEFFTLRRRAEQQKDQVTALTLDIIIGGITELTRAVAESATGTGKVLWFSTTAYGIFSNLAKYPNDSVLLRRAGAHYLVEWRLPEAALSHFQRALSLSDTDKTLPMLIEIATLAVKRKSEVEKMLASGVLCFSDAKDSAQGN